MKTTKHPYLKDILKTTAKTALWLGVTAVATPYAVGFVAGLTNILTAGYVAGGMTVALGFYKSVKTWVTGIASMRQRVAQQERDEHQQEQLAKLQAELAKMKENTHSQPPVQNQSEISQQQEETDSRRILHNMPHSKDYDRAA